jgi:hypothetical protein
MIIQSGLMFEALKPSSTFSRLAYFLIFASLEVASRSFLRVSISLLRSSARSSARMPSAPIAAEKSSPNSSTLAR